MGQITLEQIVTGLALVFAVYEGITKSLAVYKKPTLELEKRLDEKLDKIQQDLNLSLKAIHSLVEHEVTGNHINNMEKLLSELREHLKI